jgi:Flp pilus assembly protein TadB
MLFWLIVLAVAAVLFALAWWSSGRTERKLGRAAAEGETARGWATNQALINRDSSGGGPSGL